MLGWHIVPHSGVIRAVLLEGSPCRVCVCVCPNHLRHGVPQHPAVLRRRELERRPATPPEPGGVSTFLLESLRNEVKPPGSK